MTSVAVKDAVTRTGYSTRIGACQRTTIQANATMTGSHHGRVEYHQPGHDQGTHDIQLRPAAAGGRKHRPRSGCTGGRWRCHMAGHASGPFRSQMPSTVAEHAGNPQAAVVTFASAPRR